MSRMPQTCFWMALHNIRSVEERLRKSFNVKILHETEPDLKAWKLCPIEVKVFFTKKDGLRR